ncbi:hypothetical protein PC116_g21059 [Phytophthora cactorum]|uniref:Uncharacterized protein n=1 Tax=Phytophthora cactorum TaxID=29920 RepID=A0A8T1K8T7_9STRA|nr:hypothetical protein PC114_g19090 [Phytophthora cactorum]KAG2913161.1 hypothetical protein PC117_g18666 [Phytophthora cactorum]KAG4046177.1 hypothetical protein PC123_g18439 [Phytophthora cactorum]KAG4230651.1 hypothetical protein PC116_g21059 [Phytophthora cactorum]
MEPCAFGFFPFNLAIELPPSARAASRQDLAPSF